MRLRHVRAPPARLRSRYQYPRSWLRGDLLAGVTVAAYLVPQAMAYAQVAGLRPAAGLWAAGVDADARTAVAGVSQGGRPGSDGPVQSGQGVDAGGCDVVHRAWLGGRYPQREPVGGGDRLDVLPMDMGFAGVPHVDELALDAEGLVPAPVRRDLFYWGFTPVSGAARLVRVSALMSLPGAFPAPAAHRLTVSS